MADEVDRKSGKPEIPNEPPSPPASEESAAQELIDEGAEATPSRSFSPNEWLKLFGAAVPKRATPKVLSPSEDEQKNNRQTRRLRGSVVFVIVLTFWAELAGLFMLLLWQGRGGHFHLNDWLIGTVANGVILQTIVVLLVIATDLFNKGGDKMPGTKKDG